MKTYNNKEEGFIKIVIVIIIAVAILSWYGVDIKDFFELPQVRENFSYVWNFIKGLWTDYLAQVFYKGWDIWVRYIWGPIFEILKKGSSNDISTT